MIYAGEDVEIKLLKLTSTAFNDNEEIPVRYTCDGLNQSPPLDIDNIPIETKSLVIIVEDPDAPINTWVHWLVWNIPVTHHIKENMLKGQQGVNDFSRKFYCGPCPLNGTHHYLFKVYALNDLLQLPDNAKKLQLERSMSEKIIAFGQLTGLYTRK